MSLLGARRVAGFFCPDGYRPGANDFIPYPKGDHEIWKHLRLLTHLGAPSARPELEFPLQAGDFERLDAAGVSALLKGGSFICLHPGAKWATRRWPAERFAAVGNALGVDGYRIVITGSSGERSLGERVGSLLKVDHINLCGVTDLGMLGALLSRASLVITNDTGPSHMAAAVRTPSVVVVLGSDAERWAPLDRERHRVVMEPIGCRPCDYTACPIELK